MKFACSTLGCPNWSWKEIFATAKDMKIDGIEIRGVGSEMYAPRIPELSPEQAPETLRSLKEAGLEIPTLTSGAVIGMPERLESGMQEAKDYLELAGRLKVPYVRIMISPQPQPEAVDLEMAKKAYLELVDFAKAHGTCALIETNGVLADSTTMARFMEGTDPQAAGVLWDFHHPYRFCNETPEVTFRNIGKYVKYTHVKDSVYHDGKVVYRMMGYGDLPVFDILKLLKDNGYDGFITLEWVKRWNQELQEPGIVFYHYNTYMNYLMEQL